MLNKLLKKKDQEGFTIIEVLIVLAIAGLILVVVLIAIPQLQRNQRNTSRTSDASRVATSVSNWSSNNNGAVPTNASESSILDDVGDVSQYTLAANSTFEVEAISPTPQGVITDVNNMRVVTGAQCVQGGSGTIEVGVSRQFVVMYALETSSGTTGACVDV